MTYKFKYNLENKSPFLFDNDIQQCCCVLCKNMYNSYNDPFVIVIDTNSFIEITYEFCLECIRSFKNCMDCNRALEEPWNAIYFDIFNKTYYCSCCYNDKRNEKYKKCCLSDCVYCSNKYGLKSKKHIIN